MLKELHLRRKSRRSTAAYKERKGQPIPATSSKADSNMADSKKRSARPKIPFSYSLNNGIRRLAMTAMDLVRGRMKEAQKDLSKERIEKILLVRATFRMGSSILATPAILGFRRSFPSARIDFVGSPIAKSLLNNLPIHRYFDLARRFPYASWAYPVLLQQIRSVGYDLAVDVSCSQSALGSFIVGFSGARLRVGLQGKWDGGYNVRVPRPSEINKYRSLPAFLAALGLPSENISPLLILSPSEKEEGRRRMEALVGTSLGSQRSPIVGVFAGGRKTKGKTWSMEDFCQLIGDLRRRSSNVVVFFGPEEKKLIGRVSQALGKDIPLVFEPSARTFAAMVSNCDLFIARDSGPMHMACALGVRTIAIFRRRDVKHWGPPADIAKIVCQAQGVPANEVFKNSLASCVEASLPAKREPSLSRA